MKDLSRRLSILNSQTIRGAQAIYCLGILYLLIGYLATNELAAINPWNRPALPIATSLDSFMPFTPWMVIFYLVYYPLLGIPLFLAPTAQALIRLSYAQVVTQTAAYVVFVLFPTPIDRPAAVPVEGVFHTILDFLFRADHPYNTFPSMHVAQSVIVTMFFLKFPARVPFGSSSLLAATCGVLSLMISTSAILIKQHYIADAMSGALLGALVSWLLFEKWPIKNDLYQA